MKKLLKPSNAVFSAAGQTITFSTEIPSTISHILHVTNVTRGVMYFQPQGGLSLSGTYASPVLTLNASTTGHADTDKLEIFYDDGIDISISTVVADAQSLTANRERVSAVLMSYNGTTLDMLRSGITSDTGSALGYLNALIATGALAGATAVYSTIFEASRVIKASAGTLISVVGYNNHTSAQFIQLFNSTTVPSNGVAPVLIGKVAAQSNFSLDIPITGAPFTTGISICNSTTPDTKTLGAANCWFYAVIK